MPLIAQVENGEVISGTSANKKEEKKKSNDLGYDQFLQILCAEMQYQDPLEPTSNTEYIAQMATFSQLEATLSMKATMQGQAADALVGKYVIMKVTSPTTGETTYADGVVDYVLHQNGETYLSIGDALYNYEDLDTVADNDYITAVSIAEDFGIAVGKLPPTAMITLSDKETIQAMATAYNNLTEYQKSFIKSDDLTSFLEKLNRLNELLKAQEEAGKKPEEGAAAEQKPEEGAAAEGSGTGTTV